MNFQFRGKMILFVTKNIHKFNEACKIFEEYKIAAGMLRIKKTEIQSRNLQEIAKTSVLEAFKRCNLPIIVEDAGLFIEALNGFPGPYSSYVYKTIGNKGILQLTRTAKKRDAEFKSVIAYHSAQLESPLLFTGQTFGKITEEKEGDKEGSFGFDPIFKPTQAGKTFAEMTITEKNKFSHRAKAVEKFAEWYTTKK